MLTDDYGLYSGDQQDFSETFTVSSIAGTTTSDELLFATGDAAYYVALRSADIFAASAGSSTISTIDSHPRSGSAIRFFHFHF